MKLTIPLLVLILLVSCGSDKTEQKKISFKSKSYQTKTDNNDSKVCDLLNAELIKELYPDAINFKQEYSKETYPTCEYKFDVNGISKIARITAALGVGSRKNFDIAMTYLSDKEPINNIGQKAYYKPKINQISVWEGKNVIHVKIGNDKEKTIRAVNMILSKLKK